MSEHNCTVMRIITLDQYVTVESSHLFDCEDTNTTKGSCRYVKNFTFCNIRNKLSLRVALQTIECNIRSSDISLQSSSCEIWLRSFRLKKSVLDQLIFNSSGIAHLAGRSISAMEAHECIGKLIIIFALDILIIDVLRNGVVDVKQCNSVIGNAKSDVLAKSSVDIHLTGYRDSSCSKTAVYIAWLKSKL